MNPRTLVTFLFGSVCAASAHAHETWMMPSAFTAKSGDEVRLDVSSGMAFPALEHPILVERVAKAVYRLGKDEVEVTGLKTEEKSLVLRQAFPKNGVATISLDLKPKTLELTDDQVAEYLDEIDATDEIRAIWASQKGRVAWKETYTKHAKTFVAVGDAQSDSSWGTSVGTALEIVPRTSPFAVTVGHDFIVELQASSHPFANQPVGLLIEGTTEHVFRRTDADGRATFPIAKAGRAMLFTVRLVQAKDEKSWVSDFCTMTFDVHPQK